MNLIKRIVGLVKKVALGGAAALGLGGTALATNSPAQPLFDSVNVAGIQTAIVALLTTLLVIPVIFFGYRKIKQSFIK